MPGFHQKSTGTQNTTTFAFLFAALILSPVLTFLSSPIGYLPLGGMILASGLLLAAAHLTRTRDSALSVLSFEPALSAQMQPEAIPLRRQK